MFTYRAEEFPLDLEFGWNLVSFHAKPLYDWHYDFLIPGFGPMYEWDAQSQSYEGPDRLQTGRGYWIRATAAETTTVWGVPREQWTLELFPGWNIIGSISETTSVNDLDHDCGEDTLLMATMYRWNPGSKTYSIETTIEPGRAYWLASNDDCTVTLGPPEPR